MIITEPTAQSPLKSQMNEGQEETRTLQSPPAYAPYPEYRPTQSYRVEYRQSPVQRFFEAFCVAVVIYVLAGMFTSSIVWTAHHGRHRGRITWPDDDTKCWPIPSDWSAERCVGRRHWRSYSNSSQYPGSAQLTFHLPVSSDILYLLARGPLASGSVTILDSEDGRDTVQVDVVVNYHNQNVLDSANVCSLRHGSREKGVGIFTPKVWEHRARDLLQFNIKVHLPVRHSHLRINAFETDLPLFRHEVGDLGKTVEFQRLSLMASNQPIIVKSLYANNANISTSNGPITGSFNTSTSLELRTSDSFISANVGLLNEPSGKATELVIATSNGRIDSTISLSSSRSIGGSFNVITDTSNKALSVKYDTSPVDSILRHEAHTSNSAATVSLHSAYEGPFSLQSSNVAPSVIQRHGIKDPSDQGRQRSVNTFSVGGYVAGEVHWGQEKKLYGANVHISSSNSLARLNL